MIGHHVFHHLPSVNIAISVKQTRMVYENFSKSKVGPKKKNWPGAAEPRAAVLNFRGHTDPQ